MPRYAGAPARPDPMVSVLTRHLPIAPSILAAWTSLAVTALAAQDPVTSVDRHRSEIQPILERLCQKCHGPDKQKASIRFDRLDPDMIAGTDGDTWKAALDMIESAEMPPEDEPQMTDTERRLVVGWLRESLREAAREQNRQRRGVMRRLTRAQYTNTLADLLDVRMDFGRALPPDARSKTGFHNDGEAQGTSALHVEWYQAIARHAVEQAIVTEREPEVTRYRVRFGRGIGVGKVAGSTGGYQAVPLPTEDFLVEILDRNGIVRSPKDAAEKKAMEAVQRKISVGLRGSSHERFCTTAEGLLMWGALPHREVAPGSWQGPSPNVKLELQRVFPATGDVLMRVRASRGWFPPTEEKLLVALDDPLPRATLDATEERALGGEGVVIVDAKNSDQHGNLRLDGEWLTPIEIPKAARARVRMRLPSDGFYQVDLVHRMPPADAMPSVRLEFGKRSLDRRLDVGAVEPGAVTVTPLGIVALRAGDHGFHVGGPFFVGMRQLVLTPLPNDHPQVVRLLADGDSLAAQVGDRVPALRAFAGNRTDDGMDYLEFDGPREVHAPRGQSAEYVFRGRLEDLPIPEDDPNDTEILSGILVIGVWNDHLVHKPADRGPPLLIESIELEAPWYPQWPPASHRAILFDSPSRDDEPRYARLVLARFLDRTFRGDVTAAEIERYHAFWRSIRSEFTSFEASIREVLVAILCSPRFLFLAEPTDGDATESPIDEHALANRLAYFLWNSAPDEELLRLADSGSLRAALAAQVDRLLGDDRMSRFVHAFTSDWLRLDRLQQITIDADRFPRFTRFVKRDMALETQWFFRRVVQDDLPIDVLIDSDFAMLNQNLAEFYGIEGVRGPQFRPVPIQGGQERGGLLAQGAFLAGHSDGREPHPIKRAVWLKERILGDAPPPPPPNVPRLDPETPGFDKLTLREQLEAHRSNPSCTDCHASIDPYGLVFEGMSAVGLRQLERKGRPVDTATVLPDGTAIADLAAMKRYLLGTQRSQVARSLIHHLLAYGLGRELNFADEEEIDRLLEQSAHDGYRVRAMLRAIVMSKTFSAR